MMMVPVGWGDGDGACGMMVMEPRCCCCWLLALGQEPDVSSGRRSRDVLPSLLPGRNREQHWGARVPSLPTGDSSWCIWWVQVGSTHGHSFACPVQVPSIPSVPAQSCPEPPLPVESPKDVTKGRQDTEGQASVLLGLPAGRFSWER